MGARFLLLGMALALLMVSATPVLSGETNPLRGGAVERPPEGERQGQGLLAGIGRTVLRWQQEMNRELGRRMRAIRDGESSAALLVGMAMAFLYGVFHALGPGHGKFVVASYFLSREARIWRGFLMGVQIALTHVVSAVALLWLADISLRHVLGGPAADFKPLKLLSYSATGAVGVLLFVRAARRTEPIQGHHHPRETGQGHRGGWVQALASVGVGLIPCTGALLVMLYAVANEMIPTGMVLILAIAAGMAITMSGLGVLTILARHRVLGWAESSDRRPSRTRWVLEIGGAVVLTVFSSLLLIGSL